MAFSEQERAQLLGMPRIGPTVVQRLEQVGLDSLERLRQAGVDAAVRAVCQQLGHGSWSNRERALRAALDQLHARVEPVPAR